MIEDSKPWKDQLLSDARRLKRLSNKPATDPSVEAHLMMVERTVFLCAFVMRKLWESCKLSTSWNDHALPCQKSLIRGEVPDRLQNHKIEKYYDLDTSAPVKLRPEELCDRIIHSFIFCPTYGDDQLVNGFFFTSDSMRRHGLWHIDLDEFVRLLRLTGRDYPSHSYQFRMAEGEIVTWAGNGPAPAGWLKAMEKRQKQYFQDKQ